MIRKSGAKKKIVKAQNGKAVADATRVASGRSYEADKSIADLKAKMAASKAKDDVDIKNLKGKYTAVAVPDRESSFKGDSVRYYPGQKGSLGTPYIRDLGKAAGLSSVSDRTLLNASRNKSSRTYQDTASVKANPRLMNDLKKGGTIKSKMKNGGKITKTTVKKSISKSKKK